MLCIPFVLVVGYGFWHTHQPLTPEAKAVMEQQILWPWTFFMLLPFLTNTQ